MIRNSRGYLNSMQIEAAKPRKMVKIAYYCQNRAVIKEPKRQFGRQLMLSTEIGRLGSQFTDTVTDVPRYLLAFTILFMEPTIHFVH